MIANIILKLDKLFEGIYFDIEEVSTNGNLSYCIFVSDLEFYLTNKKFEKWCNILRKKYPKVRWYCCYQGNRFKT